MNAPLRENLTSFKIERFLDSKSHQQVIEMFLAPLFRNGRRRGPYAVVVQSERITTESRQTKKVRCLGQKPNEKMVCLGLFRIQTM